MDGDIGNMETPRRNIFVSMEQKRLMIEFIKRNPLLASGKFSNVFTQKDSQHLWQKLTSVLNSSPGANKDWKSWRKTWQDIRSRTKVKYSKYRSQRNATGGGVCNTEPVTPYETEVLDLIKSVSVEGHTNINESSMEFSFDITKSSEVGKNSEDFINNETISSNMSLSNELTLEAINNDPDKVEKFESANPESEISNKRKLEYDNSSLPKMTKTKQISRTPRKKLINASQASESYRISLEHKNKIKEDYYKQKIILLERLAIAKERSAVAEEKIADNIEKFTSLAEELL